MSSIDARRLKVAAEESPGLFEELSALEPEALIQWAVVKGYVLTLEEACGFKADHQELSDEDLEQVAGGWTEPVNNNDGGG